MGLYAQDATDSDSRRAAFGAATDTPAIVPGTPAAPTANYLAGAVPEVDKRVVFNAEYTSNMPKDEMISALRTWASKRFTSASSTSTRVATSARVVSTDVVHGKIVCAGDEYMVFTEKALVLDQTRIRYQLTIQYKDGGCEVTMTKITYDYNDTTVEDAVSRIPAEDQITDKYALRSNGTKLVRGNGTKFRVQTIDLKDKLFSSIARVIQ